MYTMNKAADEFEAAETRLRGAETRLRGAEDRLARDKERRSGSLFLRFIDFILNTDAEKAERDARSDFERLRAEVRSVVWQSLHDMALARISADRSALAERTVRSSKAAQAKLEFEQADGVLASAKRVIEQFRAAASACSSARSMEVMDAVTSNKGIAIASTLSTSSAKSAIRAAASSAKDLAGRLPGFNHGTDGLRLDDMPDLILDLVEFPIDFMSWHNMSVLDDARNSCDRAAERLAGIVPGLETAANTLKERMEAELGELAKFDSPYLAASVNAVPLSLRFAIPEHIAAAAA